MSRPTGAAAAALLLGAAVALLAALLAGCAAGPAAPPPDAAAAGVAGLSGARPPPTAGPASDPGPAGGTAPAAGVAAGAAGGGTGAGQAAPQAAGYTVGTACFTVEVTVGQGSSAGPSLAAVQMAASLFAPVAWTPHTRAVLLVPGALAGRGSWDGGSAGVGQDDHATLPRRLAAAGYGVVAIDRLTYPGSPLPGVDEADVHPQSDVEAIAAVAAHLRNGTFGVAEAGQPCSDATGAAAAPKAFASVVAAGFSHGAYLVIDALEQNATLDGALALAFSPYPQHERILLHGALCTAWHTDPLHRGIHAFCDDFAPAFAPCVDWMGEPATRDEAAVEAACADIHAAHEPWGFSFGPDRGDYLARLGQLPPVPLYVLNGELDKVLGHAPGDPDAAAWKEAFDAINATCTCKPTTVSAPGEGHLQLVHQAAPTHIGGILAWLQESGLGPKA